MIEYGSGRNPMSREAFRRASLSTIENRVYKFLRTRGKIGATTDEIEDALGTLHQTTSPAVIALRKRGRIRKNGSKRPTRSGRRAEVHVVV